MRPPAASLPRLSSPLPRRKHAVETVETLDFLKEIVEAVPDPSAGGTIDLQAEAAEKAAAKKRSRAKKPAAAPGEGAALHAYGKPPMSKQDLARDIFFSSAKGGPGGPPRAGPGPAQGAGMGTPGAGPSSSNAPKPTLSFFSAACAAFALGSLVSRDVDLSSSSASGSTSGAGAGASDPASSPLDAASSPGSTATAGETTLVCVDVERAPSSDEDESGSDVGESGATARWRSVMMYPTVGTLPRSVPSSSLT